MHFEASRQLRVEGAEAVVREQGFPTRILHINARAPPTTGIIKAGNQDGIVPLRQEE